MHLGINGRTISTDSLGREQNKSQHLCRHSSIALLQHSREEVAGMKAIKRTASAPQDHVQGDGHQGVSHLIERYVGQAPARASRTHARDPEIDRIDFTRTLVKRRLKEQDPTELSRHKSSLLDLAAIFAEEETGPVSEGHGLLRVGSSNQAEAPLALPTSNKESPKTGSVVRIRRRASLPTSVTADVLTHVSHRRLHYSYIYTSSHALQYLPHTCNCK